MCFLVCMSVPGMMYFSLALRKSLHFLKNLNCNILVYETSSNIIFVFSLVRIEFLSSLLIMASPAKRLKCEEVMYISFICQHIYYWIGCVFCCKGIRVSYYHIFCMYILNNWYVKISNIGNCIVLFDLFFTFI